jgi:hypothetical protein
VPIPKLPASTIFHYIVNDFETAWNAISARKKGAGRGNYLFALLSMMLLEFACRVCKQDVTNTKLANFTKEICAVEPRYFTYLPGSCCATKGFTLPGANPHSHLLGMMFDLIRNGKAHQYSSAIVTLHGKDVDMDLTGADSGRGLNKRGRKRSSNHLRYKVSSTGDLSLYIRTDQLFLDIKAAINNSKILSGASPVIDVARQPGQFYNFTVKDLKKALKASGHVKGTW